MRANATVDSIISSQIVQHVVFGDKVSNIFFICCSSFFVHELSPDGFPLVRAPIMNEETIQNHFLAGHLYSMVS